MRDSTADPYGFPKANLHTLQVRARLQMAVRDFFHMHGYWEVETPILSQEIILDAWLEPFVADYLSDAVRWSDGGQSVYLQTSPEAHMKRLLAAGADAIYQFSRVFRNGETGRRHNPEFTMLEWYRVGDNHHRQMDFVEQLVKVAFAAVPENSRSRSLSQFEPFERITYDDAFLRYAGQRVLTATCIELQDLAASHNLNSPLGLDANDRDGWLNFLLADLVEPHLGCSRPTYLYAYPASQAALARLSDVSNAQPATADRFELYIDGVELCNGYHELTDVGVLRQRMEKQAAIRAEAGLRPLPPCQYLLEAMEYGLPASCGVALGWDRLVMVCLGLSDMRNVIAFPWDHA